MVRTFELRWGLLQGSFRTKRHRPAPVRYRADQGVPARWRGHGIVGGNGEGVEQE